ncbi:nuclear transport factor 2 family protein [Acidobacteriota bacterium]
MTDTKEKSQKSPLPDLDRELVQELWSNTYNTEGKPDWSHIFPYYADDITFQDPIQRIDGITEFKAMCNRLTGRSKQLRMEILTCAQFENIILFDWIMTIMFKKFPSSQMYGNTKLILNAEGQISEQRDYFDLWGDIFDNIPRWNKIYRRFMKRKFG